jgi:hypothetical protein
MGRVSKLILFGERSLRRALTEYVAHFHTERNHQGKGNVLLFSPGPRKVRYGKRPMSREAGRTSAVLRPRSGVSGVKTGAISILTIRGIIER